MVYFCVDQAEKCRVGKGVLFYTDFSVKMIFVCFRAKDELKMCVRVA